jgi:type IV pilus assembly protein PilA
MIKLQKGFTLIELLIVVAIIGILAAIAIPSYQTYTKKAKFSEVVQALSNVKLAVEACYQDTNDLSVCTAGSNGVPPDDTAGNGKFIASVTTSGNTATSVVLTGTASTLVDSATPYVYKLNGTAPGSGTNLMDWVKDSTTNCVSDGLC